MHPAVYGALVGAGVGVFLIFAEYMLLMSAARERAKRLHRTAELDDTERRRVRSVARFSIFLPFVGALLGWIFG